LLNSSDSRAYVFEIQDDQLGSPGGDRMAPSDFGQFPS